MSKQPDYHIELMKYIEKHNYKPQRNKSITLDDGTIIENVGRTSDNYRKKYSDYREFYENIRNGINTTANRTKIQRHFKSKILDINYLYDENDINNLIELKKAIDDGYKFNLDTDKINIEINDNMTDEEFMNVLSNSDFGKSERIKDLFNYISEKHDELKMFQH